MADDADFSSELEIQDVARALSKHSSRKQEPPLIDEHGIKLCVDCEEAIPAKRAALVWVVRCIDCQQILEKEERCGN